MRDLIHCENTKLMKNLFLKGYRYISILVTPLRSYSVNIDKTKHFPQCVALCLCVPVTKC